MTSTIRLATPADEPDILAMCGELHAENGVFPMDDGRVREWIGKAIHKKGGIIGLIGPVGALEAIGFLMITCFDYTTEFHLSEQFNFVRPAFRNKPHARALIEWAKGCADELHLKLFIGVISSQRTEAKIRLYRKILGEPSGAWFVYPRPKDELSWRPMVSDGERDKLWYDDDRVVHGPTGLNERFKQDLDRFAAVQRLLNRVATARQDGSYDELIDRNRAIRTEYDRVYGHPADKKRKMLEKMS
jgi:GNAT superfamily N-acetyltransferase